MKNIIVNVGGIRIGNGLPVVVQTMCNTPTADIEASVKQCIELSKTGAQLIRLTVQGMKEAEAMVQIRKNLLDIGINTPLVADIHFTPEIALKVAETVQKVRINPGNFSKDPVKAAEMYLKLTEICKKNGTAIRIGVNHGSLGESIVERFGDTPFGMMKSAIEWIDLSEKYEFDQIVISLKSSNTRVMVDAYRLLYEEMKKRGTMYPLHLGVTEAGNGEEGRIKSAVGLASLLSEGIGNTVRVSLTENPVNEIPVAQHIVKFFEKHGQSVIPQDNVFMIDAVDWSDFVLDAACTIGPLLLDRKIDDFTMVPNENSSISYSMLDDLKDKLLQASRRKFTRPEYIACPGCGRTLFDLEKTFEEVKKRTAHLAGVNIAVMGCIVNGPGEMADADYGYVGEGRNHVSIYRGKTPVYRGVRQEEAIDMLLELIEKDRLTKENPNNT